jgi:multidrug efflux pump subunit AcrA (membrane-fusion protein)
MSETYTVVLLVEQALTAADAAQVRSLHEGLDDPDQHVSYHVLLPVEDAAARIEAAMGAIGSDTLAAARSPMDPQTVETVREESERASSRALTATLDALRGAGATAEGQVVEEDPIHALAAAVTDLDGREAIILTRPHVVAEFFHVDWTSRARRTIGVPVLHLLEHENFDEQAGSGEGVTGL